MNWGRKIGILHVLTWIMVGLLAGVGVMLKVGLGWGVVAFVITVVFCALIDISES